MELGAATVWPIEMPTLPEPNASGASRDEASARFEASAASIATRLIERRKIGWTNTLMVSTGPLTDERYLALAGDAAEGVEGLSLWPDPLLSDLAGVKRYREHMQKYFPKNGPNRYSIAGYFAAMLFTEGAKRAGRNLTRESLIAALESIKGYESGILPPLTIDADHETQKRGLWVRVEKGRFKPLTDWLKSE